MTFNPITRIFTVDKRKIPQDLLKKDSFDVPMTLKMQDYYGKQKSEPGHDENIVYYDFTVSIVMYENDPPYFSEPLMANQTIVVYKNADWYDEPELYKDPDSYNYTFPGFKDPENETVSQSMGPSKNLFKYGYDPNYMNFDSEKK